MYLWWKCVAGWIKMPLGTEIGRSPGHIGLDGDPALPKREGHSPQFSAHVYCGQTVAHLSCCWALVTFRVSRRRCEMYIGHARLCVCLSVPRRKSTLLHGHGCNLGEWYGAPSCALLGWFAIGARVSLLWQHSAERIGNRGTPQHSGKREISSATEVFWHSGALQIGLLLLLLNVSEYIHACTRSMPGYYYC